VPESLPPGDNSGTFTGSELGGCQARAENVAQIFGRSPLTRIVSITPESFQSKKKKRSRWFISEGSGRNVGTFRPPPIHVNVFVAGRT